MTAPAPASRIRLSAEERREEILAAAKAVFGRAGYHGATTREIAATAKVSEALLYQHFRGKQQLFTELVVGAAQDLAGRLLEARSASDPLRASVAAYLDFVEAEGDCYRIFFRQAVLAEPAFQRLSRELWDHFIKVLRDGVVTGELRAHALAGMMHELALWWLDRGRPDKPALIEAGCRLAAAIAQTEVWDGGTG
jgi:AcrR family transcriptional regulator